MSRRIAVGAVVLTTALALPGWRPGYGGSGTASEKGAGSGQAAEGKCAGTNPYPCARTDLDPAPLPPTPNVGNLKGANTVVTDPSFGERMVRITDSTTEGAAGRNDAFTVDCGGSAENNWMSLDDSRFSVCDGGTGISVYTFDRATMQATRMYASKLPATHGMRILSKSTDLEWSFVQNNIAYFMENGGFPGSPHLKQYDFTRLSAPPSPATLFDFSSQPACSDGAKFARHTYWTGGVNVSRDDQTFSTAISLTGNQGSAAYVLIWNRTRGCRWYNTQTGEVGGQWGASGTVNIPDRYLIHNLRLSKDGNWARVTPQTESCLANCPAGIAFWQIGTTNVITCRGRADHCGGHMAMGYTHWVNAPSFPSQQSVVLRPIDNMAAQTQLWTQGPVSNGLWENHFSWENADPNDRNPILSSSETQTHASTPVYPWDDEVDAYDPTGSGVVWRFAHTFITGRSGFFPSQNAIGAVSQDGRFFAWSSDWQGTLGNCGRDGACTSGSSNTCTIGVNCRSDVFMVELK